MRPAPVRASSLYAGRMDGGVCRIDKRLRDGLVQLARVLEGSDLIDKRVELIDPALRIPSLEAADRRIELRQQNVAVAAAQRTRAHQRIRLNPNQRDLLLRGENRQSGGRGSSGTG